MPSEILINCYKNKWDFCVSKWNVDKISWQLRSHVLKMTNFDVLMFILKVFQRRSWKERENERKIKVISLIRLSLHCILTTHRWCVLLQGISSLIPAYIYIEKQQHPCNNNKKNWWHNTIYYQEMLFCPSIFLFNNLCDKNNKIIIQNNNNHKYGNEIYVLL